MRKPFHSSRLLLNLRIFPVAVLVVAGCGQQQPHAVKREAVSARSVTLSWQPSKAPVAGYNVYRVLPPGGPIKVSSNIVTDTQFTDRTVEAGNTYLYFVTGVDSKGIESRPSDRLSVAVPASTTPAARQ